MKQIILQSYLKNIFSRLPGKNRSFGVLQPCDMKIYKHYSFDLWMTLIRSHPNFKAERTKFFYNNFNRYNKTLEEVSTIFKQIDVMCNAINEITGNNIDSEEMYLMVINAINNHNYPLQKLNITEIYAEMEQLIFKYPPVMFCADTPKVLSRLKQKAIDSSFSLLSNTAFVKGSTLRTILEQMNLGIDFDFQLYSDEVGMSKPNQKLFQLMVNTIKEKRNEPEINLKEIIHIGDNARADIGGAKLMGISSFLINSNSETIQNLLN